MGVIISVVNNKGGVGKTTVCCNLADALGKRGKKVLVVDIDSQCNATSILSPHKLEIRKTLYDLFTDADQNIKECIYPTNLKNVFFIPNISDTAGLEPELIEGAPESFFRLRKALREYALKNYDFTFLDCPPNMGTFVLCSLYASDFVIVPIRAGSAFSIQGLIKAVELIDEIRKKGNPDLRFLRLLVNAVDRRTSISKVIVSQIKDTFNENEIFKTQIPINTTFEQAESMKATIFQVDPTASGAKAYRKLAAELISIVDSKKGA